MFVEANIAQASIACQYMDDEQQCNASMGKNGGASQMLEAGFQARQELKVLEKLPEKNQTCKGCEALVFEGESGN
jgi:hypothetical protein